jgi:serine/alanine adding enzyme
MKIISKIDQISRKKWADFVREHANGNVFQTPEMFDVYNKTKKYEPVFLAVVSEKDEIQATLLAVIMKEHRGLLGKFSSRSIIWGGPLVQNDEPAVLDFILKEYDKVIGAKAIYTQFRNLWDAENEIQIFGDHNYKFEDHLDIILDLTKSEDQLWKEVHSKRRNEIRRASREGVEFHVQESPKALQECYSILEEVYNRAGLPLPTLHFFQSLYNYLDGNPGLVIFTATYQDKIIGCMLALSYNNVLYDYYAGSYKEYYKKYPNDLIPWRAFLWAKENLFSVFDFGGAGKPNIPYGVRDYKLKFGGELVNWGRYEKLHKPAMMRIGKIGLKLMKVKNGLFSKINS